MALCSYASLELSSDIRGESSVHLQGKEDLYHFAKKEVKVKLEHYLPHSKQRPDILLGAPCYAALEFQCATISVSTIYKRNHLYLKQGITPFCSRCKSNAQARSAAVSNSAI
ncbi:competence protein CoiA family protein [Bacillus sp. JCM 19041]|uniref:competence protein CoiA family protein n=1 Tax=Bacillus sp. JCM 19041 TaxID=1460637 RepID=UPI0009E738A7